MSPLCCRTSGTPSDDVQCIAEFIGDDVNYALLWLLAKLQKDEEISISAMQSLDLHESGIPGKPTLLACMRTPTRVILSPHEWSEMIKEQETHWLGSLVVM